MDILKLLRRPLKDNSHIDKGNIRQVFSPDKRFQIVFSHFYEIRMCCTESLFTLLDNEENILDNFEPLTAIIKECICWTNDSKYFAIAVRHFTYGYLFVRLPEMQIAFVKFLNPYSYNIYFGKDNFVISYDDKVFSSLNSGKLVGGGTNELPHKKYYKPDDIEIKLNDLKFYSRDNLNNLDTLTANDKEYSLELIDGGYCDFNGVFPQDTVTGYNGRPFEVYQLEAFSDYGDDVSKSWLEEIRRKTNNNYSSWNKVSDYIGHLKRKDEEKKK